LKSTRYLFGPNAQILHIKSDGKDEIACEKMTEEVETSINTILDFNESTFVVFKVQFKTICNHKVCLLTTLNLQCHNNLT
jgi:hypothetical protein